MCYSSGSVWGHCLKLPCQNMGCTEPWMCLQLRTFTVLPQCSCSHSQRVLKASETYGVCLGLWVVCAPGLHSLQTPSLFTELCPSSCLHCGTQELLGHSNDPEVLKAKSCTPLPMHYSQALPKGTLQTQPLAWKQGSFVNCNWFWSLMLSRGFSMAAIHWGRKLLLCPMSILTAFSLIPASNLNGIKYYLYMPSPEMPVWKTSSVLSTGIRNVVFLC